MTKNTANYVKMDLLGKPKGWDRSGQNGKWHYDTKKNTEMKAAIRILAQTEFEKRGIKLPIPAGMAGYSINIVAYFVPPKSTTKKQMYFIRNLDCRPKCKPDLDNIAKLWLDALVSGGIIEDDKNVVGLMVKKSYGENEHMECSIKWIDDPEEQANG